MSPFGLYSQGIIIGQSIRNGSFEDGFGSPWNGDNQVSNNPVLATQGTWLGVVQSTLRTDTYQNIPINPSLGRSFEVSFDARVGVVGFSSLSCFINTLNSSGVSVLPTFTRPTNPPLSSTSWYNYQAAFHFPESWDGSSIRVGIGFGGGISGGPILTGYLDNVIVQQVPEPASSLTVWLGAMVLFIQKSARRAARN